MTIHERLFEKANQLIPGGVNSPVRAFNSVGGTPIYVANGNGSKIKLADGRILTDFCCSWGAMIMGHAAPEITEAVTKAAERGTTFGINTPMEIEFAEKLISKINCVEKIRLVNSGTEAVMTAIRLARGITGRNKIIKFDGCYHGHSDGLLVAAGSGVLTAGETGTVLATRGITPQTIDDVFVLPYNDIEAFEKLMLLRGNDIAAVITEPVAGNMGCVPGDKIFLKSLRNLTQKYGAMLIFDEVINAFRFHNGLFADLVDIDPDIVTMGKVIGGGFPLAAVGGKAEFMNKLAPCGDIYQAGTLSGNPVAVAAGLTVLNFLEEKNPYAEIERLATLLQTRCNAIAKAKNAPVKIQRAYTIFTPFAGTWEIRNLSDAKRCNQAYYAKLFHAMLDRGFYLEPSQFEVAFISAAHSQADIENFCNAFEDAVGTIQC